MSEGYGELNFDAARMHSSVLQRLKSFQTVVNDAATEKQLQDIIYINTQLRRFGYNLFIDNQLVGSTTDGTASNVLLHRGGSSAGKNSSSSVVGVGNWMGREASSVFDEWDLMKA